MFSDRMQTSNQMMKEYPLVTVYLLLYRHFDNLYNALDSVFAQTYSNIELIVSDDGSPNFPMKDVMAYISLHKRDNIKSVLVLDNKENVGTVKHINHVLSRAKGDIYMPLAGDDSYYDEFVIEKIANRYRTEKFNLLSTTSISFDNEGNFNRFYPHILTGKFINQNLKDACKQHEYLITWRFHTIASGSSMAISADFFKQIGGHDEQYRLWEDGPFLFSMTGNGYAIDTAYDIVSIKYSENGVSSGGNALIAEDVKTSYRQLRSEKKSVGFLAGRCLDYFYYKSITKNKNMAKLLKLLYLDVVWGLKKYQHFENANGGGTFTIFNGSDPEREQRIREENGGDNPIVTAVVITYNSSETVLDTLESLKKQTYEYIELIVSDDGSVDNTVSICRNWLEHNGERFVRTDIVTTPKNTGTAANCNRGCMAATGEWLKIIAADDVMVNDGIKKLVDYTLLHGDCDIVCGQVELFGDVKESYGYMIWRHNQKLFRILETPEEQHWYLMHRNFLPAMAVMMKRNLWESVDMFDESIPLLEDWPMWLKVTGAGHLIHHTDHVVAKYRMSGASVRLNSKFKHSVHLFMYRYLYNDERKFNLLIKMSPLVSKNAIKSFLYRIVNKIVVRDMRKNYVSPWW